MAVRETTAWVEAALGRPRYRTPMPRLGNKRVLVTGASGSLGRALTAALHDLCDGPVFATDIVDYDRRLDVRDREAVNYWTRVLDPDLIFHLAGAKHAPEGEADPLGVCLTNTVGTAHVAAAGRPVVLASTGKAANPETAYGASKLIAERIVLNAGGSVARFYNVVETQGNVFDIWAQLPADEPLPVTPCTRYFIAVREALSLLLWAAVVPPGRFVHKAESRCMTEVAADVYPGRRWTLVPPRRGDRVDEPLIADHEAVSAVGGLPFYLVSSPHDAAG